MAAVGLSVWAADKKPRKVFSGVKNQGYCIYCAEQWWGGMSESIKYNFKIPYGWSLINFIDACEIISLNGIKIKQKQYQLQGKYPVIDQGQKLIGGYCDNNELIVSSEPPYIVFGDHTKVKKYINFKFIAGADGVKVLKPYDLINSKLFYYFLHCIKLPDKGYARHYQFLMKADFPIPPLAEQHRIVARIEELFSSLDKGIESLKTAQAQLKTYRQAVLKWAFEGRLTNENVKDGELPQGWRELALKDITKEHDGLRRGPFGGAIKKECFVTVGYKVYEQGNAINDDPYRGNYFINEKKYQELSNFKVLPGDLIVSCSGSLGRISLIPIDAKPGIINQALLRIRLKSDTVECKYFIYYFRASFFQKMIFDQSQGTAMANLVAIKDFKLVKISFPPIPEQARIVAEIEKRLSVCDKMEESITQSFLQAEALRQSILKKAFEGRLVPQDPADEPAAVLLERIRAEREKEKIAAVAGPTAKSGGKKARSNKDE